VVDDGNSEFETVANAAKRANVHRQSLYELIRRGTFPAIKIDGRVFVRVEDTDAYIIKRSHKLCGK
jgi:excisionase family DNA binding protein